MLRKLEEFAPYIFAFMAVSIFFYAYIPSAEILFRVEQWTLYSYYRDLSLDSLENWIRVMFWTPFNDYRLIPGAYLWHYTTFSLFGTENFPYWCISVSLHFLNVFLLYRVIKAWVPQSSNSWGALVGASIFLVLPSCYELVIWTLFGYKLLQIAMVLIGLLLFENFLKTGSYVTGFLCGSLFFVGNFFYESSLLMAAGLLSGFFLLNHNLDKKRILSFSIFIIASICTFLILFEVIKEPVMATFQMKDNLGIVNHFSIIDGIFGTILWFFNLLINSSGIPLEIVFLPNHLYTVAKDTSLLVSLSFAAIWTVIILTCIFHQDRTSQKERRVLFIFVLLVLNVLPVIIVRLTAEGLPYLLHMAIYAYFPLLLFASMLGVVATRFYTSAAGKGIKGAILALFLVILVGEGISTHGVIQEYMRLEKPLLELTKSLDEKIQKEPAKKFYVDHYLPASPHPEPYTPSETTTFSAFNLLFPGNIVADRCFANEIVAPEHLFIETSKMGGNLVSRPLSKGTKNAILMGKIEITDLPEKGMISIHLNTAMSEIKLKITEKELTVFTKGHTLLKEIPVNLRNKPFSLTMEINELIGSVTIDEKLHTFSLPETAGLEKYSFLVFSADYRQKSAIHIENLVVMNSCEGFQGKKQEEKPAG